MMSYAACKTLTNIKCKNRMREKQKRKKELKLSQYAKKAKYSSFVVISASASNFCRQDDMIWFCNTHKIIFSKTENELF